MCTYKGFLYKARKTNAICGNHVSLSVCNLLSETSLFVGFSWNSVNGCLTENYFANLSFVKIAGTVVLCLRAWTTFFTYFLYFLADLCEILYNWPPRNAIEYILDARTWVQCRPFFTDGFIRSFDPFFSTDLHTVRYRRCPKNCLCNCDFRENWPIESCTLLTLVNKFLSYLPNLLSNMGKHGYCLSFVRLIRRGADDVVLLLLT